MFKAINNFLFNSDKTGQVFLVKWIWRLVIAGIIGVGFLFLGLSFTDLPSLEQLENPKSELASEVFAANGQVLGRYYTENRVPVTYNDLSPHLIDALIATEDERFRQHSGIDFEALGRVAVKTVVLRDQSSGGASTITQQLAKQLFTGTRARSMSKVVLQKLKEWIIAVRLERKYTKDEIIAMYLNKFNFINGAYGIKAAAEIYFGKSQKDLDLLESAMLVGMLKNPSLFNPVRRPDTVQHRRMVVLKQMVKNRMISPQAYEKIKEEPLGLNFQRQTHVDGLAPYFRMELAKEVKGILDQPENKKSDGTSYNIYRDGLKIYTTIDPALQKHAEEAVIERMPTVQQTFWRTWRSLDPWTYRTKDSETEISPELRQWGLTKLIRNSDRYRDLRSIYVENLVNKMQAEFPDFTFHDDDREIERLVKEATEGGVLSKLVESGRISSSLAAQYRKALRSKHLSTLKAQWAKLQAAVDEAFAKPEEMTVFMYQKLIEKAKGEKELKAGPVTMTLVEYDESKPMEARVKMSPLDSIKYHRMFLQVGMLAVDPKTGEVKAWVGGINHKYFKYDHVRINRQVGSTFKPFVYATAIAQQGFSPCFQVYDWPVTISPGDGNFILGEEWTPRNSKGGYTGQLLTLKEGLRKSKNTVSARLMKELGDAEPVRDLVHQMGIDKYAKYPNGRLRVPRAPSISLGSTDLSVMEMTGAYTTFSNNGTFNKPRFLLRIEDKNGREIYDNTVPDERNALNPNANYVMVDLLKYAAGNMWELKSQVGGKTGTTNDYVDGWFMGITPNLVVGTWTGGEDKWIRFLDLTYGQGGYMAKPIFKEFMKRVEKDSTLNWDTKAAFYRPPGDIGIELNCDEYQNPDIQLENEDFDEDFDGDLFGDEEAGKEEKEDGTK